MKITKSYLKQVIKEEISRLQVEEQTDGGNKSEEKTIDASIMIDGQEKDFKVTFKSAEDLDPDITPPDSALDKRNARNTGNTYKQDLIKIAKKKYKEEISHLPNKDELLKMAQEAKIANRNLEYLLYTDAASQTNSEEIKRILNLISLARNL